MIYLKSKDFFMNSHSPVTTELRTPQTPYPEHAHSFEEIIIVSEGSGIHVMNDVPMSLCKNYVCFVKKEDRHLFETVDDLYLSNILFEKDKLHVCSDLKPFMPKQEVEETGWFINESTAQSVRQLIERLHVESRIDTVEAHMITQLIFQQIVIELWRGKINEVSLINNNDKVIYALSHIHESYSTLNEIDEVADVVKLSPRQLTNNIKKLTGMNFNQYLHYIRTRTAYSEIIYSEQSITDIAFKVGYQDSNYFSTKFKQVFNKTPRELRMRHSD
ncbi:AraC family transcriptional regulator [Vibrio crassostreae]|uniref:helix-turn-helix domain-containing protein n=1 Tax=Vibrio crassostreae TaxID=246167 RepID=UPI000F9AF305|nr:helix-turn-helix domain-containing protein [Vibrio crassostreae]ROR13034.1 AraC family transcriptional regulator [Vibrio crassostreae]CAK2175974.1 AraC family transcriptional regulator [Vibrio crassostreae]CAK2366231.1 AraC family transcriptional regulator [Vibrio crassostreae]CAK2380211.1 AraC family transcriptional regulator [Vibrio crassostreae]CAK2417017.1 AraC family transcriptional regulator [Vibrio crassostreae]